MNFYSELPELLPSCMFVPMATPLITHILFLSLTESILVHSYSSSFCICHYVQMENFGSASTDVEAWTLVNYLEEGGFPTLLWDTLKDFGYTAYPKYLARELMTTCRLLETILLDYKVLGGLSYGPPWAHYLDGYQDRLLCGPLGLPRLCHTAPDGVRRKGYGGEVLG
jgi:hypothetical protein